MDNVLELIKMAQGQTRNEAEQAQILSTFGAPPENFQPKVQLPVINDMPSFSIAQKGVGGALSGKDYGVPAPIPGQENPTPPTLGQLLIGDFDG